jgi:hypothetical protein
MSHYGINESLGWVYVCPRTTISFVSFEFMSQKHGIMWANPLMEYMKERKGFKG